MARLKDMTAAVPFWAVEIDCQLAPPPVTGALQPVMVWEVEPETGRPVCRWVLSDAPSSLIMRQRGAAATSCLTIA